MHQNLDLCPLNSEVSQSFHMSKKNFQDTVCTADIVQTQLGTENGDFNFRTFLFSGDSNVLDIVCQVKLCLTSENCFEQDIECDENYTKNDQEGSGN